MRVRVTRIDPTLPLPEYRTSGAVGFDLFCRERVIVEARSMGSIPSNVIVAVPEDHVLLVTLRSSTPMRTGLTIPHGIGVIDQDYRGPDDEIRVLVFNQRDTPTVVQRGDRIAQGIIVPMVRVQWDENVPIEEASRGGFGSTG